MSMLLLNAAAMAAAAAGPTPIPTGVSVISVGGSAAESCYNAAAARDSSPQALAECDSAISRQAMPRRDLVATHVNRGVLRLMREDYRAAEADFDRAMAMQPNQPEAWLNKGIARYQQGDPAGAARHFSRAIDLNTRFLALAHFGRALANEDQGDIPGAYADLRRAASLNPQWSAPADELKRYRVVPKPSA